MLNVFITEYLKYLSKRKSVIFFSAGMRGLPLPVNVPVSRHFFNSLLSPRFVQLFLRNLSVNLFAVYPFKYKLCIKILSSSLNTILIVDIEKHCSDVCCDEFPVPQIDRKSKKVKCICNQYCMGKDSLFLTPKTSKFVGE